MLSTIPFLILFFALSSCSSDDSTTEPNENEMAAGNYTLIAHNINPPQDINEDGNTTSNVLTELPCATGTLVLNANGNWTWTFVDVNVTTITGGLFKFNCASGSLSNSGTWQVQNNILTLFDGFNSVLFTVDENRLTNTTGKDLPDFESTVYEK